LATNRAAWWSGPRSLVELEASRVDVPCDDTLTPFLGVIGRNGHAPGRDPNDGGQDRGDEAAADPLPPNDDITRLERFCHTSTIRLQSALRRHDLPNNLRNNSSALTLPASVKTTDFALLTGLPM